MKRSTRKSYGGAPASSREVALRQLLKRTNLTSAYRAGIQSEYNKLKAIREARTNISSQSGALSAISNMFGKANENAAKKNAAAKAAANEAARAATAAAEKASANAAAAEVAAKQNANRKAAEAANKAQQIKNAATKLAANANALAKMIGGTRKRRH